METVVFSGTTEGRKISEYLSRRGQPHHVCVATESGEKVMTEKSMACVHVGRMDEEAIRQFLAGLENPLVIDATHPYAEEVTENIANSCEKLNLRYIRVIRDESADGVNEVKYADAMHCASALINTKGNIFLTTGSRDIGCYCKYEELRSRIFVRVLPNPEVISGVLKAGIPERNIIAMYGPHTAETNAALIRQYDIRHMVTKISGSNGGFAEKIHAAESEGCQIHLIARPVEKKGISLEKCIEVLNDTTIEPSLEITLAGVGMGDEDTMTVGAQKAIKEADIILGAPRMIEPYKKSYVTSPLYKANDIISYLDELIKSGDAHKVAVLFSGDTGLYSGASKLYEALNAWGHCSRIKILPGISSFSAFAAMLGESLTDAHLTSLHGKSNDFDSVHKIKTLIENGDTVYILMSGKKDFDLLRVLIGSNKRKIDIGFNISYDDQRFVRTDSENLLKDMEAFDEGLFIVRIWQYM